MRIIHLASVAALVAAPAFAGGTAPPPAPPVVVAPVAPSTDWSGFYAGLQLDNLSGDLTSTGVADIDGTLYGVFAGYRHDFGTFVLGGELDYMVGDGTVAAGPLAGPIDYDSLLRLGVEAGFDAGQALIYGTAGYADMEVTPAGLTTESSSGYFYGVGADFLVSERVVLGVEVLQHHFEDFSGPAAGTDVDALTVGLNLALRF
jgi:opacity protein-like surface antigen